MDDNRLIAVWGPTKSTSVRDSFTFCDYSSTIPFDQIQSNTHPPDLSSRYISTRFNRNVNVCLHKLKLCALLPGVPRWVCHIVAVQRECNHSKHIIPHGLIDCVLLYCSNDAMESMGMMTILFIPNPKFALDKGWRACRASII